MMRTAYVLNLLLGAASMLGSGHPITGLPDWASVQHPALSASRHQHQACDNGAARSQGSDEPEDAHARRNAVERNTSPAVDDNPRFARDAHPSPAGIKPYRQPREAEERPGKWNLFIRLTAAMAGITLAIASLIRAIRKRD